MNPAIVPHPSCRAFQIGKRRAAGEAAAVQATWPSDDLTRD